MTHVTVNFPQELYDIVGADIVVKQLAVEIESFRPRRSNQCTQCRNAVMSCPRVVHGRLSSPCPHAPAEWLQHVPTFIEKNQASVSLGPLFLSRAKSRRATARSRLRFVPGRAVEAFVGSTLTGVTEFRHSRHGTLLRTTAGLPPGLTRMSNLVGQIPRLPAPDPTLRQVAVAAQRSVWAVGQDAASGPIHAHRDDSTPFSSDWQTRHSIQLQRPLPSTISLAQKAGPQFSDELPTPRVFLMVSCRQRSKFTVTIPLIA